MAGKSCSSSDPVLDLWSDVANIAIPTCGNAAAEGPCLKCDDCQTAHLLDRLKRDASDVKCSLENLSIFGRDLRRYMQPLADRVLGGNIQPNDVCAILEEPRFRELTRAVKHFKLQLPFTSYYHLSDGSPSSVTVIGESDRHPPRVHTSAVLTADELERRYDELSEVQKKCLCFCSVFDSEIKKRVLINWWIGEKLLPDPAADSPGQVTNLEQAGEAILESLQQKQFIHRVHRKRRATNVWLMQPPVQLFVRAKAKADEFFDLDSTILSENVMLLKSGNEVGHPLDANEVKTVFNVDRLLIGVNEAKALASMEGLTVLHLGRSQRKANQHIQVKNLKLIMKRINKMKQLRLLSLQGISAITKLSDSVGNLKGLVVLDLRAYQALESLPSSIADLKSLTRLDMSGCYILLPLPKELSSLTNLEVLKGFVIRNLESTGTTKSCTLADLQTLKKLHKLSITVSRENFPQHQDLKHLANIVGLVKLKIVWIPATSQQNQANGHSDQNRLPVLNEHGQEYGNGVQNDRAIEIADSAHNVSDQATHSIQYEQAPENNNLARNQQVLEKANQVLNSTAESSMHWTSTLFKCCFRTQLEKGNKTGVLEKLEKLDMWYAPEEAARLLLAPRKLTALKKLYIRCAKFQHLNFNHVADDRWNVEMLRLLSLPNLEMSWAELKDDLFPRLSYLEQQDCPKLQLSQYCDDVGVWNLG